jgi:hypothetical protein
MRRVVMASRHANFAHKCLNKNRFLLLSLSRLYHRANPKSTAEPKVFGATTSLAVLRKHLFYEHLDTWVAACDKLGIDISAREAKPYMDSYR